ncbi:MAG: hypothetical protein IT167_07055 [Bryobacterales bacterium]|nr:hypothetical protein [Bryobacterales bacterium]
MLSFLENEAEPMAARVETINGNVAWLEMNLPVQYRSLVRIELSHYLLLGEVFCCRKHSGPYCVGVELQHSVSTGDAARIASELRSGRHVTSSAAGHYSPGFAIA